mgnify:CR=1 FL=1
MLRVNITFTSTPEVARQFYKKDLTNGFFGRIPFAYKERGERSGRIPRQGSYSDEFLTKLDACLLRLTNCKGPSRSDRSTSWPTSWPRTWPSWAT